MNPFKILLVEDDEDYQNRFENSVEVFKKQHNNLDFKYDIKENVRDVANIEDISYDGAIIDLHLDGNDQGGNEIVQNLHNEFSKIPIIFVTSFADSVDHHPSVINIRRREDGSYHGDLTLFLQIRNSGLTHIIGRKGLIEDQLREVYLNNLLPQIETWNRYGEADSERTERALLRYTLNHLSQLLEEDTELFFPEEVYLYPPATNKIMTGSIVKENNRWFVVLSPACDLVIRNGQFKTERILFVEIEKENKIVDRTLKSHRKEIEEANAEKEKKYDILQRLFGNNHAPYFHWLPSVVFNIAEGGQLNFEGGFLNFRKLESLSLKKFRARFKDPSIQISPFFLKDIVSRFSSYYARQGQPDIENKKFIEPYIS